MFKNKIFWVILFFLAFGITGYCREYLFVHLNNILYQVYFHKDSTLVTPNFLKFLLNMEYAKLYYLKYPLTILSVVVFYCLNYFTLKKLGSNKLSIKILLYAFIVMLSISILSMAYAYLIKDNLNDDEYTLSRWLMGIAQSPIISLILLASEKLYTQFQTHE